MSRALEEQIEALDYILANRLVDADSATKLSGAKGSLQFLAKHEEGIRAYIGEVKAARESPLVKGALREFPDADVIVRRG